MASRSVELRMHTGDSIQLSSNLVSDPWMSERHRLITQGTLIPPIERIAEVSLQSEVDYVLVVEKDASHRPLERVGIRAD